MADVRFASIGLVTSPEDPYGFWYIEALEQTGLPVESGGPELLSRLEAFHVLVLGGYGDVPAGQREALTRWVDRGGRLVVSGSTWGLDRLLGVAPAPGASRYGRGLLSPSLASDRLWPEGAAWARFFGGTVLTPLACEVVASDESDRPLVTRGPKGICVAPHVGLTLAMMTMGRSVEQDAIGPGDGSAVTEDAVLRAEDGSALDWRDDRVRPDGSPHPVFLFPHADTVREVLARAIVEAVESTGRTPLAFWPWPDNAPAVACASVDCDDLNSETMAAAASAFTRHGMPAGWYVPAPGFPGDVYRIQRRLGHETALLLRPDQGRLTDEQARIQNLVIGRGATIPTAGSARLADGQWLGRTRVYEACEAAGIRLSTGKGGRQPGTSGFLFGTSRIVYPWSADGRRYHVAELPSILWAPGIVTPAAALAPLIEQVQAHHGCLHLATDTASLQCAGGEPGLVHALMLIREAKLYRFTPSRLAQHEAERRTLRRQIHDDTLQVVSEHGMSEATFLIGGAGREPEGPGRRVSLQAVRRWGTMFTAVTVDLEPKRPLELRFPDAAASHLAA